MKIIGICCLLLFWGRLQAQTKPVAGVGRKTLLTQILAPQTVEEVKMEAITLAPGAAAPAHYHPGEVYGYVTAGEIWYQPAGDSLVRLHAGDPFREAAGKQILVFKNAQTNQPATFLVFYLLKKNQPVIILQP
ncbi:cupin domain-containing protein [Chitinophaga nivalis]|uniref:Cupin domain-containing protein n=1 Tax=Chitinophaga nivalis TaxID=2991709 RepID=A0ABT3IGK7_9BACT|nr:cupin domain-containing protein [Chitinophaga nivalis]MCW3467232.1 cupin domain-containing protein [Chitinophaga nivalis]MCW3483076.1 cupin domain-containing protein [Chitinophaga nivalis]